MSWDNSTHPFSQSTTFGKEEASDSDVANDWDASSEEEKEIIQPKPKKNVVPEKKKVFLQRTKSEIAADIERENFTAAGDLFGVKTTVATKVQDRIATAKATELNSDFSDIDLGDETKYIEFADKVFQRLTAAAPERRAHPLRIAFLKQLLTVSTESFSLEDLNEVKKIVTVLCNSKIKHAAKKKRKGKKGKTNVSVGRGGVEDESAYTGGDFDDMF